MITFGATSWSQPMCVLLTDEDKVQDLYADSAYTGDEQEKVVNKYGMKNCIHELSEAKHEHR